MKFIITMAGQGSRFRKAGFDRPKYELIVKNRSMFEWALLSLSDWFETAEFIFIARSGAETFIHNKCKELGIAGEVLVINHVTDGQATSAIYGLTKLKENEPFAVYNIDTHIHEGTLKADMIPENSHGWIPVFDAEGTHWSFVEMLDDRKVVRVAEKSRISNWATVGLYYFSNKRWFTESYNRMYMEGPKGNLETYIAPLYQDMLGQSALIYAEVIASAAVVPLGTPEEVRQFDDSFMR